MKIFITYIEYLRLFFVQTNDATVVKNNYPYAKNFGAKCFEDKDLKNQISN